MIKAYIDYEFRNFKKKNNYLLCGGSFFFNKKLMLSGIGIVLFNFNFFSPFHLL